MPRSSWILFLVPVVIWSTTFYAITFQLNSVTPEPYSVGVRFLVASLIVFIYLLSTKSKVSLSKYDHGLAAVSGVFSYAVSYVLTYVSELAIPSGLVAIAFTLMVFLTPAFARVAYGHAITRTTWVGGSLGVLGVILCFLPGALLQSEGKLALWAVFAMLIAAVASSIAAVVSMKLNERRVPVATYTAWSMAYGGGAAIIYALLFAPPFALETRLSFWLAFVYLAVLGTVITFLCYLELMRREGSARAMYIGVLSPVGALLVSIALEGLRLDALAWAGIGFALAGAFYTLRGKST